MSGSVTVGESGDAVLVHVTGQIGRMGGALYVVDDSGDELWLIGDPTDSGLGSRGRLISIRSLDPVRHHVARRGALRGGQHGP